VRPPHPLNPNLARASAPPIIEASRWVQQAEIRNGLPLLNLSQAAPVDPPPEKMRQAMAEMVLNTPSVHLYGPVLGLGELRLEIAAQWSDLYGGQVTGDQVAITSGCNEAFCAVLATLAGPGDEVILPVPWYFNHKMALDMGGQVAVPLQTGLDLVPDPTHAASLITSKTRAIVLISPNNPCGVEYDPEVLSAFRDLARSHAIALVIDETYRDFHGGDGRPHDLFTDPDWDETLIHLYSFSKAYRLTGHRIGAILTSAPRLREVEKYLDTVTICPSQLGQMAALWGLRNLRDWLAGEREEVLSRRGAMTAGFPGHHGWSLLGCGAYFGYVAHPFDASSDTVARWLVSEAGLLGLPGTIFRPEGDPRGSREMRLAFANMDGAGIAQVFERLTNLAESGLRPRDR